MNWEDRTADYYINNFLRQREMSRLADEIQVERVYRQLAGDFICKLTSSIKFGRGKLRLRFRAAALRQEMTLRKESLRTRMNEELGGEVVQEIIIL